MSSARKGHVTVDADIHIQENIRAILHVLTVSTVLSVTTDRSYAAAPERSDVS